MASEKVNARLFLVERIGKMWQTIIIAIMIIGVIMMVIDVYNAGKVKGVKVEDDFNWK